MRVTAHGGHAGGEVADCVWLRDFKTCPPSNARPLAPEEIVSAQAIANHCQSTTCSSILLGTASLRSSSLHHFPAPFAPSSRFNGSRSCVKTLRTSARSVWVLTRNSRALLESPWNRWCARSRTSRRYGRRSSTPEWPYDDSAGAGLTSRAPWSPASPMRSSRSRISQ